MRRLGWLLLGCSQTVLAAQVEKPFLGLYGDQQFNTVVSDCHTCQMLPQAKWYFKNETFAIPTAAEVASSYSADKRGADDIEHLDSNALPGLIWTGSTQQWTHARLLDDGQQLELVDGEQAQFEIVAKISTNLSYWNQDTRAFYAQRTLSIRGEQAGQQVIARTIWPEDFRLNLQAPIKPLQAQESLKQLVQFEQGGARSDYESRLLWQREPGISSQLAGKAALGVLLNGAQGDDDEAHGGHFALVTGRMAADGSYDNWLVNNYYNLATNSEKGIIAGVTPMDKYMADLNSGQAFYRPSYMLVAVFSQPAVPAQIQALSNRVFQHFYRNDLVYDHALNNCSGISIDVLRQLGWKVPERGSENLLKASAAYWYVAATERSLLKGRAIYDYLSTEMTRLFPAVAFDAIGNDLLHIAQTGDIRTLASSVMQPMAEQLEAIYFVRIPQIPSSRADGLAPVYSFDQYLHQAPADRSQWKIIPVTPNPLPAGLKDGLALKPETPALIPIPAILFLISVVGIAGLLLVASWKGLKRLFTNTTKN
jgi:hypothetical protein